ncbi:flagellar biosynthesis protein [Candidatus Photodesmus blepharus]|uniref:Flagellar biosynthesis protein n=1 Tax=Candidatus Photodesmus blepharonis TaxID=1179155 RepID=A0A084CME8_9GAMM|nr:flagellar export chaperone FlgN [Candidatus Photodesmus blepharus]KEY90977.1 flagellar biosynthesis protein [Candidatus Photodesmus blepharus]
METLFSLLEFQLKNADKLSDLLTKEKLAVAYRISNDIEQLAKEKITLINQLKKTDNRIGAHPDILTLTEDKYLKGIVERIRTIIHDCKQANLINGEALNRTKLSFNRLNSLIQQEQSNTGITYNSIGQKNSRPTLGTNIKA